MQDLNGVSVTKTHYCHNRKWQVFLRPETWLDSRDQSTAFRQATSSNKLIPNRCTAQPSLKGTSQLLLKFAKFHSILPVFLTFVAPGPILPVLAASPCLLLRISATSEASYRHRTLRMSVGQPRSERVVICILTFRDFSIG